MSKATNPAKLATVCCPECGHGFDVDVNWLLRKVGAEAALRSRDEAVRELSEALREFLSNRDFVIAAGGAERPLSQDVIVQFAHLQNRAVKKAEAALAAAARLEAVMENR